MTFQIFQSDKNQEYYFRMVAKNGKIVLQSEGYTTKQAAENGVESVMRNGRNINNYKRKIAENGKNHFSIIASNGQTIAQSQMYENRGGMEQTIQSIAASVEKAQVQKV